MFKQNKPWTINKQINDDKMFIKVASNIYNECFKSCSYSNLRITSTT